jgi:hypothetical protein
MDPIAIVGFTACVITFVDFTSKLLKGIYEVHQSLDGATEENAHLSAVIEDLQSVTGPMQANIHPTSNNERELVNLAGKCTDISKEILKTLNVIKASRGNPRWESIKGGWRATLRKGKIASLEKQISDYRSEIILRLNIMLV